MTLAELTCPRVISGDAPLPDPALAELAKFFGLAMELQRPLKMWSKAVDAAWHTLLESPQRYQVFCLTHCGAVIRHIEGGSATPVHIDWISEYEARHGPIPTIWFTDSDGRVDERAIRHYEETGEVRASWDCSPQSCDAGPPPTHTRPTELPPIS